MSSKPRPGVAVPKTLTFEDDDDELSAIFGLIAAQHGFELGAGVEERLRALIPSPHPPGFGNGRFIRNVFEEAVSIQAERLVARAEPTVDEIRTLVAADLPTEPPPDDPRPQGFYL